MIGISIVLIVIEVVTVSYPIIKENYDMREDNEERNNTNTIGTGGLLKLSFQCVGGEGGSNIYISEFESFKSQCYQIHILNISEKRN